AGLLVVVGFIGWAIGRTVAGNAPAQAGPRLPRIAAAALAVDAVVLGQLGLWLHAISQGGALELVPYLAEARGLLVPLEIGMAGAVAWWTAR
ncbi:MAG TPA: hypothetical protein VM344_00685, partial [Vitreimonas sp.]|nr:hypothetical protein [Vitreimonas sp.]